MSVRTNITWASHYPEGLVRSPRFWLLCLLAVLVAMYGIALFRPSIGLVYSEGATLLAATSGKVFSEPPLFPALLGVLAAISRHAWWLKLLPLLCTIGWLALTKRLLSKMGASDQCGWVLVAMTAASPAVLRLATGLYAEPLFALLATACLIALLEESPLVAGLCAGLATITMTAGVTLVLACLLTFVAYRRLRNAVVFTIASMVFASPWLGWAMANGGMPLLKLHLSEIGVLVGKNAMWLAAAPFSLLSGYATLYRGLLTALALLIVLVRRRQFVPDLFFGFYCVALLIRVTPPLYGFVAVLPMFLWILWRAVRVGRFEQITKVVALALLAPALWFGAAALRAPNEWGEMEKLFAFLRANTPSNAVVMADLDPLLSVETGRKTVRGFVPDDYVAMYGPPQTLVAPDQLLASLVREHVGFVVLTPDPEVPESVWYRDAVEALERGGVLETVPTDAIAGGYRVLRVAAAPGQPLSHVRGSEGH